jgi:phage terminase large subunit
MASWGAWEAGLRRILLVWHRRAGKDDVGLNMAAVAAHMRPANYWHCLPMYEQARKAIWEAINPHTGLRRIDEAFPKELRRRTDNGSMTIEFHTGSIWRVVGSDNPDSLVGAPPAGIVFSEWALANPSAWAYLAPILEENDGWAVFITTPRGRNHVKSMFDMARDNPSWFAEVLPVTKTGAISLEAVEKQRAEYHAIFGVDAGDALIEQEYFCSFEAAVLGAYYGREMVLAEQDGRIRDLPWQAGVPVHTAWDIGVSDDTSIWCFQVVGPQIHVIDFHTASGYGPKHYVDWLNTKPYAYGNDYVPHDAKFRQWTGDLAKARLEELIQLKRKPVVVPLHKVPDGINAGRQAIGRAYFDREKCAHGLEALRQYRREWDDDKKCFKDKPLHDWASDPADAWRYLAMAWKELKGEPDKKKAKPRGIRDATFSELMKSVPKRGARV